MFIPWWWKCSASRELYRKKHPWGIFLLSWFKLNSVNGTLNFYRDRQNRFSVNSMNTVLAVWTGLIRAVFVQFSLVQFRIFRLIQVCSIWSGQRELNMVIRQAVVCFGRGDLHCKVVNHDFCPAVYCWMFRPSVNRGFSSASWTLPAGFSLSLHAVNLQPEEQSKF